MLCFFLLSSSIVDFLKELRFYVKFEAYIFAIGCVHLLSVYYGLVFSLSFVFFISCSVSVSLFMLRADSMRL